MAGTDPWDRFVALGHDATGPIIPADCYRLYIELGERGFTLRAEVENDRTLLVVTPPEHLRREDDARLRRWRWHLLLMLDHFSKPDFDSHLYRDPSDCPICGRDSCEDHLPADDPLRRAS